MNKKKKHHAFTKEKLKTPAITIEEILQWLKKKIQENSIKKKYIFNT